MNQPPTFVVIMCGPERGRFIRIPSERDSPFELAIRDGLGAVEWSKSGWVLVDRERPDEIMRLSEGPARIGHSIVRLFEGWDAQRRAHYELAARDGLTGLMNRAVLMDVLPRLIAGCERHHRPLSIAMLDLDHMKHANDRHGFMVGDELLVRFAKLLEQHVHDDQLLARYGGEEFIIVMPDTEGPDAVRQLETLRRRAADHVHTDLGMTVPLTVSIGVAELDPGDDFASLIRRTDELLGQAKMTGRNRTCAGPLGHS